MLTKRLIPCLDIDAGDPVEVARAYSEQGADELVFLDITASSDNRQTTYDLVAKVASEIFIPLTVGGGVRQAEDAKKLLNSGADKVAINTSAIERPSLLTDCAKRFGKQCVVGAIDAKRSGQTQSGFEVFSHGGRKPTGLDALCWAKQMTQLGAGELLLTSMDKDGSKQGFDIELTSKISQLVKVPVIASGGVGTLEHLADGIIQGGADAVLAASIFHFATFSITQAKQYLKSQGIAIRL